MSASSGWSLAFSAIAVAFAVAAYFHEPAPPAAKPAAPSPPAKPATDPAALTALDRRVQEAQRQIDGLYETVARLEKQTTTAAGAAKVAEAAPAAPPVAGDQAAPARPAAAPGAGRGFGGAAFAGGDITTALKDQVGLDDAKAAKVKAILDESRVSMRALPRGQQGGGGMEKFRELRQQTDDKVAAILTPEEMEKFKKLRGQFAGGMRQRGAAGGAGAPAAPAPVPVPAAPALNPL